MFLAEDILAQGKELVYIGKYYFEQELLVAWPKYDGVHAHEIIPIAMWLESICQNGEIYCRETWKQAKTVVLTRVQDVTYIPIQKKDADEITYRTTKLEAAGGYVRSEILVLQNDAELFRCSCTHHWTAAE